MKPVFKIALWTVAILLIAGGLALPKVRPLLNGAAGKPRAVQANADGPKAATPNPTRQSESGAPLKVSTFVVKPAPFAEKIVSTGTLRADEGVELQAETNGKIVAINFTEGTKVKKGDLLVKLNDADLRASVARANYRKELAKTRERRYAQLLGQKVVTQDDYDEVLSEVNVQQAEIDLYRAQIAETEIRAPFDGVVGLRYVSEGAYVNASTRIATLQRVDKLKVDFALPEKYTGRVAANGPIAFTVAGGAQKFQGEIYAIDPRIDSGTRTLLIRALCPNGDGRLLPGAFANIELTLAELPNALLIPSEAVIPGLEEKNVFVMRGGKAERRTVETGTRTATTVHILAGLEPGDIVITSGLQQMRVGQAVTPLSELAPSPDGAGALADAGLHATAHNAAAVNTVTTP